MLTFGVLGSVTSPATAQAGGSSPPSLIPEKYVDINATTNSGTPDVGSISAPARSISWALDAFQSSTDKIILHVAPGDYLTTQQDPFVGETWPIQLKNVTLEYWDRAGVLPAEPAKVKFVSPITGFKTCFAADGDGGNFSANILASLPVSNPVNVDSTKGFVISGFKFGLEVKDSFLKKLVAEMAIEGLRSADCERAIDIVLLEGKSKLDGRIVNSIFYGGTIASGVATDSPMIGVNTDGSNSNAWCNLELNKVGIFASDQDRAGPGIQFYTEDETDGTLTLKNCDISANNGFVPASVGIACKSMSSGLAVSLDSSTIADCTENGVYFETAGQPHAPESFTATGCNFVRNGSDSPNGQVFNRTTDDSGIWLIGRAFSGGQFDNVSVSQCWFGENFTNGVRLTAVNTEGQIPVFLLTVFSKSIFKSNGKKDLIGNQFQPGKGLLIEFSNQKLWSLEVQRSLFRQNSTNGIWAQFDEASNGSLYLTNCIVTECRGAIGTQDIVFSTPLGFQFLDEDSKLDLLIECCTVTNNQKSPYAIAAWIDDGRASQDSSDILAAGVFGGLIRTSVLFGNDHPSYSGDEHWFYPVPTGSAASDVLFNFVYGKAQLCNIETSGAPSGVYPAGSTFDSDGNFWSDTEFINYPLGNVNYGLTFPDSSLPGIVGTVIDQGLLGSDLDGPVFYSSNPEDIRGTWRQTDYFSGEQEFAPPPYYRVDIGAFELDPWE